MWNREAIESRQFFKSRASTSARLKFLSLILGAHCTSRTSTELHHIDNHFAIMGRLHSNGKGISASAIPYSRTPPAWLKTTPEQVVDQICKLAKKGATPSQIGVVLRDSHGIAQVKVVTGNTIVQRTSIGRPDY